MAPWNGIERRKVARTCVAAWCVCASCLVRGLFRATVNSEG